MKLFLTILIILTNTVFFACSKDKVETDPENYFKAKWKVDIEKKVLAVTPEPNMIIPPNEPYTVALSDSGKVSLDLPMLIYPVSDKEYRLDWQHDSDRNVLKINMVNGIERQFRINNEDRKQDYFIATLLTTVHAGSVYRFTKIAE